MFVAFFGLSAIALVRMTRQSELHGPYTTSCPYYYDRRTVRNLPEQRGARQTSLVDTRCLMARMGR